MTAKSEPTSNGTQKRPIVVIAGQVPPPTGGQNVMIQRLLDELSADTRWRTVHLPFFFTPSFQSVRRFRFAKIVELFAVWLRFLKIIATHGRPDLLIYPSGGPQAIPVIRDILLLPLFCAFCRKIVVQFHAAGIADRLKKRHGLVEMLLAWSYRGVGGAVVMTEFNRCDPISLGIEEIEVIPHRLPDENAEAHLPDYSGFRNKKTLDSADSLSSFRLHPSTFRILHAGHLYDLKGTPQLVEAFGAIAAKYPCAKLVLMGEFLPPYSEEVCRERCRELDIEDRIEITGVLKGKRKAAQFRSAHLFIFPSIAPYESFGLVMVEAMMWGLPIVASDWRGNRDVAGPKTAYVPADDALHDHLSEVLQLRLSAPTELSGLSVDSRQRYEKYFQRETGRNDYQRLINKFLFQ